MTLTEYAARRGVSKMAVSKAVARGRLVESVGRDEQGRPVIVDAELADREWEAARRGAAPQLSAALKPHDDTSTPLAESAAPPATSQPAVAPAPTPRTLLPEGVPTLAASTAIRAAAAARKEQARAELAELELADRRGAVVDAEEARADVIAAFSLVKTRLLAVAQRVGQRLPRYADEVVPVVDELIREALEELAARGDGGAAE